MFWRKDFFVALAFLCFGVDLFGKDYGIDKDSKIGFEITKFLILSVDGVFKDFSGHLSLDDNASIANLHIQALSQSVSTGKEKRDKLARDEFLKADKHPHIRLRFVSYTPKQSEKDEGTLVAKLTIQGKSKNIDFQSKLDTSQATPKLTLKGKFNSKDFGVKGKMTRSNTVHLILETKWLEK